MEIRKAKEADIDGIISLLYQVNQVHAEGRSDIFKLGGIKYTKDDLAKKLGRDNEVIFVAAENDTVLGYMFGEMKTVEETTSLQPRRELYIDDICVDEKARGNHVGKSLYDFTKAWAREQGFYHITLHVWELNPVAKKFYENMGMVPLYTSMETIL